MPKNTIETYWDVGRDVGLLEGLDVGVLVGANDGFLVGFTDGLAIGFIDGFIVGFKDGFFVGALVDVITTLANNNATTAILLRK